MTEFRDGIYYSQMKKVTVKNISKWLESDAGGMILPFSPENFKMISYYLHEFATEAEDPRDRVGAFQMGKFLVVGKRWFLDGVKTGLGLME